MNLFLRFFVFFWLMAVLLASSFFALGRLSGAEAVDHAFNVLQSQAETVATLLQQGGWRAARRWIQQQPVGARPHLLDAAGQNPFSRRRHMSPRPFPDLQTPLQGGIYRQSSGLVVLVSALPEFDSPLFLVQQIAPHQLHRLPLWSLLLSALLIISLVSYLLATLLSRRILQLRHAVQEIADGNLQARVALTGKDEVSALGGDFNRMADQVQSMLDSQRQLVRDVSHELRSPLARLRIALELGQRKNSDDQALARIEKEADELETLVTHLLSLARIESGQSYLEKQRLDIAGIIQPIVHDANFEGAGKQCEVVIMHCDSATLSVDPVLLRSAIENVIRNALRYSPGNSVVGIDAQQRVDSYQITIEDSGPGVDDDMLEKLFRPFTRVSKSRDRASGGFGLGLAITGQVLQAHGGSARAENRAEGGLRVVLNLPVDA